MPNNKRIAIVYDWMDSWGGVERILLRLHTLFPQAAFFTSVWDPSVAVWSKNFHVKTTFLQHFPQWLKKHRLVLLPFFPTAFETLCFDEYDLVISVTSSFAKGIITRPETKHVCYLLTPPRYFWSHTNVYFSDPFSSRLTRPFLKHFRKWDSIASHRPDMYIAISQTVAQRCLHYYAKQAKVIYPPFDCKYWDAVKQENIELSHKKHSYFLWVGRMEKYKRIDLIVKAAQKMKSTQFLFAGTGSYKNKLEQMAPKNCQFLGRVSETDLSYLYSNAKALVMPQEEDFGYVALEAQYFGCPVIAYNKGGATETILEQKTGIFFNEQTIDSLRYALERYEQISYNLRHSTKQVGKLHVRSYEAKKFDLAFRLLI